MAASKKGFDKDYIFNLIMPSSSEVADEALPQSDTETSTSNEDAARDSLSILQEQVKKEPVPVVKLRPAKEIVLVNLMEQLVAERLEDVFAKFNCCRCDKCQRDVAALALNTLPPHYVVAEPDELPQLLSSCPTKEISAALIKAILSVKSHPQH